MSPDERRTKRNRLMEKLHRSTNQAECNALEAAVSALDALDDLDALGLSPEGAGT